MINDVLRAGLIVPLIVMAVVAGLLGFFVGRQVAPDAPSSPARVSVISLPSTPTPAPTPEPTSSSSSSRVRVNSRDRRCPAGCECEYPAGGIVIVCR